MTETAAQSSFSSLGIVKEVSNSDRKTLVSEEKNSVLVSAPVIVLIQTCYEQWGKWRNYHLFRLFALYKNESRVRFSVDMVVPKMALEVRIDDNVIYSRLMRSGYHNFPDLTEFLSHQIRSALNGYPLQSISMDEYSKFMESFRRRDSDCIDETDMRPNDDAMMSTGGNSVPDRTNAGSLNKQRKNQFTGTFGTFGNTSY